MCTQLYPVHIKFHIGIELNIYQDEVINCLNLDSKSGFTSPGTKLHVNTIYITFDNNNINLTLNGTQHEQIFVTLN